MKISTVRFYEHPLIGTQLEPRNSLTDRRVDPNTQYVFGQVELSRFDDTFLRVDMYRGADLVGSQLLPWASVATVLFTDE
jgi:hypothetical protein